jgi:hypothetical protein
MVMRWNVTNAMIFTCAREQNGAIPCFLDHYTIGSVLHASGPQKLVGSTIPRPNRELLMEI